MKIKLNNVLVSDQQKAQDFYTEVLGFETKVDLPIGEFRWLTVGSREDPEGAQLLLEPNAFPAAAAYQNALYEAGIPLTSFAVDNIKEEIERLKALGVEFRSEATDVGTTIIALFDDSCGNFIQIYQEK